MEMIIKLLLGKVLDTVKLILKKKSFLKIVDILISLY